MKSSRSTESFVKTKIIILIIPINEMKLFFCHNRIYKVFFLLNFRDPFVKIFFFFQFFFFSVCISFLLDNNNLASFVLGNLIFHNRFNKFISPHLFCLLLSILFCFFFVCPFLLFQRSIFSDSNFISLPSRWRQFSSWLLTCARIFKIFALKLAFWFECKLLARI